MRRRGSPLRFLALVLGGWVMLRAATLWPPFTSPEAMIEVAQPHSVNLPNGVFERDATIVANGLRQSEATIAPMVLAMVPSAAVPPPDPQRLALALLAMMRFGSAEPVVTPASYIVDGPRPGRALELVWSGNPSPTAVAPSRWSGSFWLIARDGRGLGASLTGSQLGGSQAGARLAYALGSARRVAIVGRIASPLAGAGQEGAIGIEWRPTRLPVRLVAEQRIGINGADGGPSVAIVGGINPLPIAESFRLEGYGQAGIIGRSGVIGYADGAVRVHRQVAMIGDSPIDVGGGGWGAIQPGVARLDLGPSIGARLPVGANGVRISLDWRQRVAGMARPGSGPALSIGTDF